MSAKSSFADDRHGCDLLVLGGGGLAGQAVMTEARRRGLTAVNASRRGEVQVDAADQAALFSVLHAYRPRWIINCAAIVSIPICEADPRSAWTINARLPLLLADYARSAAGKLIHISTDHYYSGDGDRPHRESEPVVLLNEYARTKYAGEQLAMFAPSALIVRTNIVGLKSATGTSFGEWALDLILNDRPGTLFADQFVSTLDIWSFAAALLDLAAADAAGVVNLASSEVFSKADLVLGLAHALGRTLTQAKPGTVASQTVTRPDSLGLDVSRAESILGRRLPNLTEVAANVARRAAAEGGT
jgi:dTDP-4-dehydrorhamnose reductase